MNDLNQHSKRLMGVWDLSLSYMSIGDLLILIEELKILSNKKILSESFDIAVIGQPESVGLTHRFDGRPWILITDKDNFQSSSLISMLMGLEGVERCYFFQTTAALGRFLDSNSNQYFLWPELQSGGSVDHQYGYTLFIQDYYRKAGHIPFLYCKSDLIRWAQGFIREHADQKLPIAVHLKNKIRPSGKPDWYNARFDQWHLFFTSAQNRFDAKFILIGNEPIPSEIRNLSNVVISMEHGGNLIRDLALIQTSAAFMGVASGPCQVAMFGKTPYVIYKNPEHHVERMYEELGDLDRYIFALPMQKFFRRFEVRDHLLVEFESLYDYLCHARHRKAQIS